MHIRESTKIVMEPHRSNPENTHSCTSCSADLTDTPPHSDKERDSWYRNRPLK